MMDYLRNFDIGIEGLVCLLLGVLLAIACMLIGAKLGQRRTGGEGPLLSEPDEPDIPTRADEYEPHAQ